MLVLTNNPKYTMKLVCTINKLTKSPFVPLQFPVLKYFWAFRKHQNLNPGSTKNRIFICLTSLYLHIWVGWVYTKTYGSGRSNQKQTLKLVLVLPEWENGRKKSVMPSCNEKPKLLLSEIVVLVWVTLYNVDILFLNIFFVFGSEKFSWLLLSLKIYEQDNWIFFLKYICVYTR